MKFNRDVVVDLICYRRFGHNEGDEPSFTQPLMYEKIRSHPSTIKVYGKKLIEEQVISNESLENSIKKFKNLLDDQFKNAKNSPLSEYTDTWAYAISAHSGDSFRSIFIELKRRRQDGSRPTAGSCSSRGGGHV